MYKGSKSLCSLVSIRSPTQDKLAFGTNPQSMAQPRHFPPLKFCKSVAWFTHTNLANSLSVSHRALSSRASVKTKLFKRSAALTQLVVVRCTLPASTIHLCAPGRVIYSAVLVLPAYRAPHRPHPIVV